MPLPDFVRPPVPVITPPKVAVTCGLETVSVRLEEPMAIAPFKVRPWPEAVPANATSPVKVMALASVRIVPSDRRDVPPARVSIPVPTGPAVTAPPTVLGVLSAPKMTEPAVTVRPVVQLLLALVRMSDPVPVLLIALRLPAFCVMAALMMSPIGDRPLTTMTGLALLNSSVAAWVAEVKVPVMVGVVVRLSFTTVKAEAELRISLCVANALLGAPSANVGVAVPPMSLKFTAAKVFV